MQPPGLYSLVAGIIDEVDWIREWLDVNFSARAIFLRASDFVESRLPSENPPASASISLRCEKAVSNVPPLLSTNWNPFVFWKYILVVSSGFGITTLSPWPWLCFRFWYLSFCRDVRCSCCRSSSFCLMPAFHIPCASSK